ncbi:MAG: OPT/YSL family transporter [Ignisphaera sp.]|nr:OPT/YSL family transporter [Ignisphaera sp.]MCX8167899.1 OPT/YSL family transporter [Ignisphaera sp.]MDW8085714.1 hypothetical protein [Ignisphaera sp.]
MENKATNIKSIAVGIVAGSLISFINSYGYAVSGYTTAEASLIIIPILTIFIYKMLRIKYTNEEFLISVATALGIDITTTLTSGMYITFGFLNYSIERLRAFGLDVSIPSELFSGGGVIDVYALPTYVSLSIISASGAFIAYTFRSYFIEKERLRYPFAVASAILMKTFRKLLHRFKEYFVAFIIGFAIQIYLLFSPLIHDLTPLLSSIIPGSMFALTFSPLVFGLFLLMPLAPLRMVSLSSLVTYLLIIPITVNMLTLPMLPAMSYDEALFAIAPIVVSLNLGVVTILLAYYLLRFRSLLASAMSITLKLSIERTTFIMGIALLSLLVYMAFLLGRKPFTHLFALLISMMVLLHVILLVANMRVVGEVGMGSQALFPVVTFIMYLSGVREAGVYAAIDPYTGIPMPQVVGGATMNLFRFSRFFKGNTIKILKSFCIGMLIGSLLTYLYGNILIHFYGFDSPQMPLTRWIPTIVWMATVYGGRLAGASLYAVVVGLLIGAFIVVLSWRRGLPIFSIAVGLTLPPDIGFIALLSYLMKSMIVKLGVELHEKIVILDTIYIMGAGIAIAVHILLSMMGVAS